MTCGSWSAATCTSGAPTGCRTTRRWPRQWFGEVVCRLMVERMRLVPAVALACAALTLAASAPAAGAKLAVTWMHSYRAPGTPAKYDKVGVLKVGRPRARNVLVLEPG